jgi:hypothetical protein
MVLLELSSESPLLEGISTVVAIVFPNSLVSEVDRCEVSTSLSPGDTASPQTS